MESQRLCVWRTVDGMWRQNDGKKVDAFVGSLMKGKLTRVFVCACLYMCGEWMDGWADRKARYGCVCLCVCVCLSVCLSVCEVARLSVRQRV